MASAMNPGGAAASDDLDGLRRGLSKLIDGEPNVARRHVYAALQRFVEEFVDAHPATVLYEMNDGQGRSSCLECGQATPPPGLAGGLHGVRLGGAPRARRVRPRGRGGNRSASTRRGECLPCECPPWRAASSNGKRSDRLRAPRSPRDRRPHASRADVWSRGRVHSSLGFRGRSACVIL
jgi:hypothetical protein